MSLGYSEKTRPNTGGAFTTRGMIWCSSISTFVGVGRNTSVASSSILTSTDGVTWTYQTSAENNDLEGVTFAPTLGSGNGRLVAVSASGTHRVQYSDDKGVTWSTATAATAHPWRGVAWSSTLALFVAVASAGSGGGNDQVMTSSDGISWSTANAVSAKTWNNVVWADGRFIATANSNTTTSLMSSTNGTAWSALTTPVTPTFPYSINCLAFSPDLGMWAVTFQGVGNQYGVMTSTNHGANWTNQTMPAQIVAGEGLYGIQWAPELSTWLVMSDYPGVITSTNGTSWAFTDLTSVDATASWTVNTYNAAAQIFIGEFTNHDKELYVSLGDAIAPTQGNAKSNAVTISTTGHNGGFTAVGGTITVYIGQGLAALYNFDTNNPYTATLGQINDPYGQCDNVVVSSTYALTCTTPWGQGASDVLVFNNGAAGHNILLWLPAGFTFSNPTLTSLLPTSGPSSGGTAITITGTGLFSGILGGQGQVTFGGLYASNVTVVNATTITCNAPVDVAGSSVVDVVFIPPILPIPFGGITGMFYYPDSTLAGAYTYVSSWWSSVIGPFTYYQWSLAQPTALSFNFGFFYLGIYYPAGTVFPFIAGSTPTDTGWWLSIDDTYTGGAEVVNGGIPRDPRSYHEITTFATGDAAWLGGFPGPACVLNNHLIYAKGGYTAGTDAPPINIFDGTADRELLRLPNTSGGTVPRGVMTMLAANGTIYLATFDTGTDSSTWVGRVFSLDYEAATLTPLGAAFPTGHMPYALAWHAGRLWCGTHRQDEAAAGKIYWFRPAIDTAWTEDRDLSSDGMAGVSSMLDFQGNLYVGTTAAAGTFAKIVVRDTLGAYTAALTATGGAATDNNGFLALTEFSSKLYASYWNADTPNISKIYKYDGSSWATAYSGASGTLKPYVGFPTDNVTLLAIGGGAGYQASLISTLDGTTWSDRTAFLSQGTPVSVGLPAFGVVVR